MPTTALLPVYPRAMDGTMDPGSWLGSILPREPSFFFNPPRRPLSVPPRRWHCNICRTVPLYDFSESLSPYDQNLRRAAALHRIHPLRLKFRLYTLTRRSRCRQTVWKLMLEVSHYAYGCTALA